MRPDRVYVMLQGVLGAIAQRCSAERWTAAIVLCARAGKAVGIDPAVPVVRALIRPSLRPAGTDLPSEIKVFAPALALAGLLGPAA
jgi:hypothetical protein